MERKKSNKCSNQRKEGQKQLKVKNCDNYNSNNQVRTEDVTSSQWYTKVVSQNLEATGKQIIGTQTQAREGSSLMTSPSDLKPITKNTMVKNLKEEDTGITSREEKKLQYYMELIQRREKEESKKKNRRSNKTTSNQEPNTTKGRRGRRRKHTQNPE